MFPFFIAFIVICIKQWKIDNQSFCKTKDRLDLYYKLEHEIEKENLRRSFKFKISILEQEKASLQQLVEVYRQKYISEKWKVISLREKLFNSKEKVNHKNHL